MSISDRDETTWHIPARKEAPIPSTKLPEDQQEARLLTAFWRPLSFHDCGELSPRE
jgi:hypothetical protein